MCRTKLIYIHSDSNFLSLKVVKVPSGNISGIIHSFLCYLDCFMPQEYWPWCIEKKKKAHLFSGEVGCGKQPRTKGHFKVKDDCFRRRNHSWIQLLRRGKIIISAKITLWYACKDNKWYRGGFRQRCNNSVLHPAKPKDCSPEKNLISLHWRSLCQATVNIIESGRLIWYLLLQKQRKHVRDA